MDLTNVLLYKALFPPGKSSGAKVAIWNGEADLTDGEMVKFSDETPTVEELRGGYLLAEVAGKYYGVPLDGTFGQVTLYENQGAIAIMWGEEMGVLFAIATKEAAEIVGMESGIYRSGEYKTEFTDNPMILVW